MVSGRKGVLKCNGLSLQQRYQVYEGVLSLSFVLLPLLHI
jgi:hypothetical protein